MDHKKIIPTNEESEASPMVHGRHLQPVSTMYETEYRHAYKSPPQEAYKHEFHTSPHFLEHLQHHSVLHPVQLWECIPEQGSDMVDDEVQTEKANGSVVMNEASPSTPTWIHRGGDKRVGGARYTLGVKGPLKSPTKQVLTNREISTSGSDSHNQRGGG